MATFEEPVKKLGDRQGFIDLLWKGVLLVEQKSEGRDLTKAKKHTLSNSSIDYNYCSTHHSWVV